MILSKQSDIFGALASTLCLIHCLITPLIFVAQTCSLTCCASAPAWWRVIDLAFLIISFFAIYASTNSTTKNWLKISFWVSWVSLFMLIINENFHFITLAHESIYVPSLALILLHFYNKKYCTCSSNSCCVNQS